MDGRWPRNGCASRGDCFQTTFVADASSLEQRGVGDTSSGRYSFGQNAPLTRIFVEYFAPREFPSNEAGKDCLGRAAFSCCFVSKFLERDTRAEVESAFFAFLSASFFYPTKREKS